LNLNNVSLRYFDIYASFNFIGEGLELVNTTNFQLEPCTERHWDFGEEVLEAYSSFQGQTWLCPSYGTKFNLGGKTISDLSSVLNIGIYACNNATNPNCITPSDLATLEASLGGQFRLFVPLVSTVINPGEKQYVGMSFEDRNHWTFSTSRGL
jgi:hypothetical protein